MIKRLKKVFRSGSRIRHQIKLLPWQRKIYSIALMGLISVACYFNFQSSQKIGFYMGLWGFVGLLCALTAGLLLRQHRFLSSIPLLLAIFCEVSVHTEYLLQEADYRRQLENIIIEKRNRFLKLGKLNTAKSWPERTRSAGEIKAEVSERLNKRIPRYGNTVRNVTKNCTANYYRKSAWIECNQILELKQELAQAIAMAETDEKAEHAYARLDSLKIIPRSNRLIAKLSQWVDVSETDLEVSQVAGRAIGLQIIIMIMTHLTFAPIANGSIRGSKRRRSKWKPWRFGRQSASNVLRFGRKASAKNNVEKFLSDCTIKKCETCTGSTKLYEAFIRYQNARNLPTYTHHIFGAVLKELGFKKRPAGPHRLIHYVGIELSGTSSAERNLLRNIW